MAVFWPSEGAENDLEEALRTSIPAVHEEPGCVLYALHRAENGSFVLLEKWESEELLDRHSAGPAVAALSEAIKSHLASEPEVVRLLSIPVGDPVPGNF
ncbi:putative quinol monooxygenase [Leucobacter japonicus]|uniref:putative quinol monooxygenase n=1 Tax=Leucobacter japonicus TaxID=1461259 RepID=UPI001F4D2B57|nr:putative quinol monooxygenase [Leucobacter japonicus]